MVGRADGPGIAELSDGFGHNETGQPDRAYRRADRRARCDLAGSRGQGASGRTGTPVVEPAPPAVEPAPVEPEAVAAPVEEPPAEPPAVAEDSLLVPGLVFGGFNLTLIIAAGVWFFLRRRRAAGRDELEFDDLIDETVDASEDATTPQEKAA